MSRSMEPDRPDFTAPAPLEYRESGSGETPQLSRERQEHHIAQLRETIDGVTHDQPTMSELIERLEEAGVRAVPSLQESGRLNGMSYEMAGIRMKGSDLGRAYTAQGLQQTKGVTYDAARDRMHCSAAARREKENPIPLEKRLRDTRERDARYREFHRLSAAEVAALREIGRFRTLLVNDFIRIQYGNDARAWRQDYSRLARQGLIEQRSIVVTTHSKEHQSVTKALAVVVLTKTGKELLRRCDTDLKATGQAVYAGFVKAREIAHDAAIYRMYQAEAASIEAGGGRVKRVVLDFELKKKAYSPLATARRISLAEYSKKQGEVAEKNGLKVIEGKIRLPDLRIEYETESGEVARVDLELATEHYRGNHMSIKSQAGFKIYAESASFPSGGSSGRSGVSDDHRMEIFSF